MLFLDTEAILVVRQILLLMLCRNERKRAVLKTDDSRLAAEPVPENIAKGQAPVIRTKQIDEKTLEPMTFEGFAFVGVRCCFEEDRGDRAMVPFLVVQPVE